MEDSGETRDFMKRYGNLFPSIVDRDNIVAALHNASAGKMKYDEVVAVHKDIDAHVDTIVKMLTNKTYVCSEYIVFTKIDKGKVREIAKLPFFPDRIVQHAILQILEPIWKRTLITDTFQSIKGRGVHSCLAKVKVAVQVDRVAYCLQIDIKKFYPSIDNHILKQVVRKKIKCKDTLWLLGAIIDSSDGVPIGNYISQYFGNLYLSELDHYIKEVLKIEHYYRYCDDLFLLGNSKEELWSALESVRGICVRYKLCIKENYQVFAVNSKRGVDCLGYVVYPNKVKIRRSIVREFVKKVNKMHSTGTCNSRVLGSYYGWFKHSDAVALWLTITSQIKTKTLNQAVWLHKLNNKLGVNNACRE